MLFESNRFNNRKNRRLEHEADLVYGLSCGSWVAQLDKPIYDFVADARTGRTMVLQYFRRVVGKCEIYHDDKCGSLSIKDFNQ